MVDPGMLDEQSWLKKNDPSDMLGLIEGLPQQFKEAERIARSMPLPKWPEPRNIAIVGMGGSAIGGDLVRALAEDQGPVPIVVQRNYTLPKWVGKDSLVVASSYSGNTEETLAAYAEAEARGARVIAITTGGELAKRATGAGWPVVRIPGGMSPRAAIGYSFVPLLVVMERLGIMPSQAEALAETVAVLEGQSAKYGRQSPMAENPAKALAAELVGRAPLILGPAGWQGIAAYRWKCQFNENSKAPAFWNVFPELNHNETVGWEHPLEVLGRLHVVLLRDALESKRNARRVDVTKEIMAKSAAGITEFWAEGKSSVARLFSLLYPGDFVSGYLALAYGTDPTPIKAIDHLKSELQKI